MKRQRSIRRPTSACHSKNSRRAEDSRRGIAALEAAVVTPMLLVLVLGTIEMGSALRASTLMQSSVREAGRLASMDWTRVVEEGDTPNAKLERDVQNYLRASGINIYSEDGSGNQVEELDFSIVHADGPHEGEPFDMSDPDNNLELATIQLSLPYSQVSVFPTQIMGGSNINAKLVVRVGSGGGLSN